MEGLGGYRVAYSGPSGGLSRRKTREGWRELKGRGAQAERRDRNGKDAEEMKDLRGGQGGERERETPRQRKEVNGKEEL